MKASRQRVIIKRNMEELEDQREYVACLKCTNDCYHSAHINAPSSAAASSSSSLLTTAPSFLKVLDHAASDKPLEIPQYFVDEYLRKCWGSAKLEGPSGWVWYAPFIRSLDANNRCNLALGSLGWDDFAMDHGLQSGDLLVFTYFGSRQLFKIRIFDPVEGTEKSQHCLPTKPYFVHVPAPKDPKPVQEKYVHDHDRNTEKELGHTCGQSSGSQDFRGRSGESNDNGDLKVMNNNGSTQDAPHNACWMGQPKSISCSCCNGIACCSGEIKSNSKILQKGVSDKPRSSMHDMSAPYVETQFPSKRRIDEKTSQKLVPASTPLKALTYPRYKRILANGYNPYDVASPSERERVIREANAFQSKNPFTIKLLPASSIYKDRKLLLPSAFVRDHMPRRNALMTWVDNERKEWRCQWLAKRCYNHNIISFVSAGWAAFVKGHCLIERDVLVLELISPAAHRFRVHIFKQKPCGDDGSR